MKYFEDNYICGNNGTDPTYPISFWSTHDRVLQGIPKTNNSLEAWHSNISKVIVIVSPHPNIARCLEVLKQEEQFVSIQLKRLFSGVEIETTRSNFKELYKLQKLLENRDLYDDEGFSNALMTLQKWKTH